MPVDDFVMLVFVATILNLIVLFGKNSLVAILILIPRYWVYSLVQIRNTCVDCLLDCSLMSLEVVVIAELPVAMVASNQFSILDMLVEFICS